MTNKIAQSLQDSFDTYYPEGPTDLQYLRFYANLAVRTLFYAEGQGVLDNASLAQLIRQAYAAEQAFSKKETEEKMLIKKYGATWCPPCQKLDPILNQIDKEYENVTIEHFDVDEVDFEVLRENNITGIPVMFIYDDEGKQTHRIQGAVSRQEILESLNV